MEYSSTQPRLAQFENDFSVSFFVIQAMWKHRHMGWNAEGSAVNGYPTSKSKGRGLQNPQ
jgi:hypothetical protein